MQFGVKIAAHNCLPSSACVGRTCINGSIIFSSQTNYMQQKKEEKEGVALLAHFSHSLPSRPQPQPPGTELLNSCNSIRQCSVMDGLTDVLLEDPAFIKGLSIS